MVMRERVTVAVVAVLTGVAAWYGSMVWRGGLSAAGTGELALAIMAIVVLTSVFAGAAAVFGSSREDERDARVAMRAQAFRGYLHLLLAFALVGWFALSGQSELVNAVFLALLGIEIVSGIVMLVLYRVSA